MGQKSYAVIDQDEELEFKETNRSDAHQIFNQLIERCNTEMSKAIASQTMTSDNGSSMSQAEVHERILGRRIKSISKSFAFFVTDTVFPMLSKNGFDYSGYTFEFDTPIEITQTDIAQDTMLLQNLAFDNYDHFLQKYGITNAKATKKTTEQPTNQQNSLSISAGIENIATLSAEIDSLYNQRCQH